MSPVGEGLFSMCGHGRPQGGARVGGPPPPPLGKSKTCYYLFSIYGGFFPRFSSNKGLFHQLGAFFQLFLHGGGFILGSPPPPPPPPTKISAGAHVCGPYYRLIATFTSYRGSFSPWGDFFCP